MFMKNNPALPKNSTKGQRWVAVSVTLIVVLIAGVAFALKKNDRRAELRSVIASGDDLRLEQLLENNPKLVEAELPNRNPRDLWSPLHMAACYGDLETVEILLKYKAKVNARDANGLTPLHWTVSLQRHKSAEFLINKGADMNAKGNDGRTPIELAKLTRDKKMIEYLRIRGAKE